MIIRFDKERMIFQHLQEQIPCGVHNKSDAFSFKALQNPAVNIIRHSRGYASRQYEYIAFSQHLQLFHKLCNFFTADIRPHPIDFGSVDTFQLDIDTGNSFFDPDKIRPDPDSLRPADDLCTGETGYKAKRSALDPEICQDRRDVDPFAARKEQL